MSLLFFWDKHCFCLALDLGDYKGCYNLFMCLNEIVMINEKNQIPHMPYKHEGDWLFLILPKHLYLYQSFPCPLQIKEKIQ